MMPILLSTEGPLIPLDPIDRRSRWRLIGWLALWALVAAGLVAPWF